MDNRFDFYRVTVKTTRKADLIKAGVQPSSIVKETRPHRYGHKVWPRTVYTGTVGFVDMHGLSVEEARAQVNDCVAKWQSLIPTATVSARYFARD